MLPLPRVDQGVPYPQNLSFDDQFVDQPAKLIGPHPLADHLRQCRHIEGQRTEHGSCTTGARDRRGTESARQRLAVAELKFLDAVRSEDRHRSR